LQFAANSIKPAVLLSAKQIHHVFSTYLRGPKELLGLLVFRMGQYYF